MSDAATSASIEETRSWLALAATYLRGEQATALIEKFGGVEAVVQAGKAALIEAGLSESAAARLAHPDSELVERTLSWLEQPGHHLIPVGHSDYPPLLAEIPGAPALLYINGDPQALQLPALAIVGSRNPTRGGVRNAHDFAMHLGSAGFCIVSGLAQGIDTAAHDGALAGGAKTVAFLGHGIDRVYPAENHELAHRISRQGALITEYPLGSPPKRDHFPERNRMISGCSMGTLVVEAARRSGSLITARLASEQGREVFAIPGSIHNALSRGCHELIRQGAKLVESSEDIVSELGSLAEHLISAARVACSDSSTADHLMQNTQEGDTASVVSDNRDDEYKLLIKALGHDPANVDELAEKSGLTIDQVSSMLLILELDGEIEALHGGQFALLRRSSWHERKRTRRADVSV